MNVATSGGHLGLALGQRVDLAVLDDLDDLLLDRLADPLQLLRAPVERELRDRALSVSRIRAAALPVGARSGTPSAPSSSIRSASRSNWLREPRVFGGSARRHPADHTPGV